MNWYNFIFFWIIIMAIVANNANVTTSTNLMGEKVYRWKFFAALIAFLPVFFLASMGKPRFDTVAYLTNYNNLPTDFAEIKKYLSETESGKGFVVFQYIIKTLFNGSESAFRIILAAIHSIPVLLIFRKYSDNYIMSLYLFVASACHIGWMMNGLRQFMAVAIIMAATPLMLKKKYVPLIGIICLAATIHSSALIMLPVVFIVPGKAWNKKTLFYILIALVAMYAFNTYTDLLDTLLIGTEYEGATSSWISLGDDGVNPLRVIVNIIPMGLAWIGRRIIEKDNNPVINLCINMSIITVGLYLIAMVTSGIMLGRLPIYTSLYNYILLPYLVKRIFNKESYRFVVSLMVILYFVYYLFET